MELYGILIIALIAGLNRLLEIIQFNAWLIKSLFQKLRKKHFKLYRWIRSWDIDELRYVTVFGIKIPLHPIFWDGYHCIKNLTFLILIIAHCILTVWWMFFIDGTVVYLCQWVILKIMVKKLK